MEKKRKKGKHSNASLVKKLVSDCIATCIGASAMCSYLPTFRARHAEECNTPAYIISHLSVDSPADLFLFLYP